MGSTAMMKSMEKAMQQKYETSRAKMEITDMSQTQSEIKVYKEKVIK